ncbi:hypothetical protein MJ904_17920 [Massilia sp. MB5]|uniref:hypothetical protein n=1 Tax=Massilia sp. MB5 TaxID=2919578 RepID=UPI001F116911|nr:hypothetical protein [Massilia sp. MB5]UMR28967.1 hypothetical protein MJ904_17920 [Massilia sp. MB5]
MQLNRFPWRPLLAGSLVLMPTGAALASPPAGPYARMVVIQPKPGQDSAFEAGYEKHLEWHRQAGDSWTWHGWSFVLGERLGYFMDGTFGHAPGNFDNAVQPAADRADNQKHVEPHADFLSHGVFQRLDGASVGAPLPDTSPYLALITYQVLPGQGGAFEQAWTRQRSRLAGSGTRYSLYRLQLGGSAPQYMLMRAVPSFGAAANLPEIEPALAGMVHSKRSELLAYRANLSYQP